MLYQPQAVLGSSTVRVTIRGLGMQSWVSKLALLRVIAIKTALSLFSHTARWFCCLWTSMPLLMLFFSTRSSWPLSIGSACFKSMGLSVQSQNPPCAMKPFLGFLPPSAPHICVMKSISTSCIQLSTCVLSDYHMLDRNARFWLIKTRVCFQGFWLQHRREIEIEHGKVLLEWWSKA